MTTDERLDVIRKRCEAATPGPWAKAPIFKDQWPEKYNDVANVRGVRIIGQSAAISCGDEAEFIAHSRSDIPWLLEEIHKGRLKLAAVSVAALQNTRDSTLKRIGKESPYWSASYDDVCTAIDREISLREDNTRLRYALETIALGKISSDNDNAQIMAGRFWRIAQAALQTKETK